MDRKKVTGLCIMICFLLTGCGSTLPPLTEEQEAQVVDYAVKLALQYDRNYVSRLVELDENTENEPSRPEEEEPSDVIESVTDTPVTDVSQEGQSQYTIEQFFQMDGLQIQYQGVQICSSYPEIQEDAFALDAAEGMKLLVLSFAVTNITEADAQVNFLDISPGFRISLNGNKNIRVMSTMGVEDDMMTYIGSIPAGGTVNLVMIAEVEETEAADIQSLVLSMRKDSEINELTLQ